MGNLIEFPNLIKVLDEYADAVYELYTNSLIEDERIASGDLLNSVKTMLKHNGNVYTVELRLDEAWRWIEWDTKPHWPPLKPILEWIQAKPVLPTPMENGKLPTEEQLAFLISRKISEEGTKGTHNLQKTLDEINAEYSDKISDAVAEDINEALIAILVLD